MDLSKNRGGARPLVPATRIMEDEGEVVAWLEMPGVTREGLDIKIDGSILTIEGRRSDELPRGAFLLRERRHAPYRKAFTIDESVDRDSIAAELVDGVLLLRLKIKEAAKPRKITVA